MYFGKNAILITVDISIVLQYTHMRERILYKYYIPVLVQRLQSQTHRKVSGTASFPDDNTMIRSHPSVEGSAGQHTELEDWVEI